jgi:hypothetical protein
MSIKEKWASLRVLLALSSFTGLLGLGCGPPGAMSWYCTLAWVSWYLVLISWCTVLFFLWSCSAFFSSFYSSFPVLYYGSPCILCPDTVLLVPWNCTILWTPWCLMLKLYWGLGDMSCFWTMGPLLLCPGILSPWSWARGLNCWYPRAESLYW